MRNTKFAYGKGYSGLYRYYRCTRKAGVCPEPHAREKLVIAQCLEFLKPLAISAEEANFARAIIDEETKKDGETLENDATELNEKIVAIQQKLNKLTRMV